jgi:hypothetical protein
LMFVPRATVILEGSAQPGSPRQPWKLEFAAARASRRTTVPVGKKLEHVPEPLPLVIMQLIPAGCEVIVPLPLSPGTIEMLPWVKWNWSHTVMIAYFVTPPAVPMMSEDWAFTWLVETLKVALAEPAGTVTLAGTVAAAALSLDSDTRKPPAGAAEVNDTVPVDVVPPTTSLGFTVTADSAGVDGEETVQPDSVAAVGVPDPSSTATRQSAGGANGSRSILKAPVASLVPIATPFTVMDRFDAAVPSSRSLVPDSSAREMRTAASAGSVARTVTTSASDSSVSGRKVLLMMRVLRAALRNLMLSSRVLECFSHRP